MQIKTLMAMAATAATLGGFAQPAFSENRSTEPMTSNNRITAMMMKVDQFQARQKLIDNGQRYYVQRQQPRGDTYAMRSSSYALRR